MNFASSCQILTSDSWLIDNSRTVRQENFKVPFHVFLCETTELDTAEYIITVA